VHGWRNAAMDVLCNIHNPLPLKACLNPNMSQYLHTNTPNFKELQIFEISIDYEFISPLFHPETLMPLSVLDIS